MSNEIFSKNQTLREFYENLLQDEEWQYYLDNTIVLSRGIDIDVSETTEEGHEWISHKRTGLITISQKAYIENCNDFTGKDGKKTFVGNLAVEMAERLFSIKRKELENNTKEEDEYKQMKETMDLIAKSWVENYK